MCGMTMLFQNPIYLVLNVSISNVLKDKKEKERNTSDRWSWLYFIHDQRFLCSRTEMNWLRFIFSFWLSFYSFDNNLVINFWRYRSVWCIESFQIEFSFCKRYCLAYTLLNTRKTLLWNFMRKPYNMKYHQVWIHSYNVFLLDRDSL